VLKPSILISSIDFLKKNFNTGKTKPVAWRKQQLKQLLKGINEMKDEMTAAVEKDLGKASFVTELTSLMPCKWDIDFNLKHIDQVS
jgi:aldehyde dehydrogenase (NAD+)